jgi:hypothetical protein
VGSPEPEILDRKERRVQMFSFENVARKVGRKVEDVSVSTEENSKEFFTKVLRAVKPEAVLESCRVAAGELDEKGRKNFAAAYAAVSSEIKGVRDVLSLPVKSLKKDIFELKARTEMSDAMCDNLEAKLAALEQQVKELSLEDEVENLHRLIQVKTLEKRVKEIEQKLENHEKGDKVMNAKLSLACKNRR